MACVCDVSPVAMFLLVIIYAAFYRAMCLIQESMPNWHFVALIQGLKPRQQSIVNFYFINDLSHRAEECTCSGVDLNTESAL